MPSTIDYSKLENWAAHPVKDDPADRTPDTSFIDNQAIAAADVFFLHPTTLTKRPRTWNADILDRKINQKTDDTAILHQASIFNGAGRVYAPRYRQAHFASFFSKDKNSADAALDLAYADINAAFEYFLENENNGRPIIIASHSQGAIHAKRLLKTHFDGQELQKRLVCAYVIGWPVVEGEFENIPPCESAEQTGCVCSWRSFKHGYLPKGYTLGDSVIVTNPLTWTTSKSPAPKELNEGTVLSSYNRIYPQIADAQIHDGVLWVHKPKFPGSIFFLRRNYHIADLNLYHVNVRNNAELRAKTFSGRKPN